MDSKLAKQLQELQKENSRLKKLVADHSPDDLPTANFADAVTIDWVTVAMVA